MTRDDALAHLRSKLPLLRAAGVRGLSLFGSTARNEAGPNSDVDVLLDVDFEARPQFSLIDLSGIANQLQSGLQAPVHPIVSRGLRPAFRERIESYAISVQ